MRFIALLTPITDGLTTKEKEGTIGVVVSLYTSGTACEVEIWDETENPIDVVTYLQSEIEAIK